MLINRQFSKIFAKPDYLACNILVNRDEAVVVRISSNDLLTDLFRQSFRLLLSSAFSNPSATVFLSSVASAA